MNSCCMHGLPGGLHILLMRFKPIFLIWHWAMGGGWFWGDTGECFFDRSNNEQSRSFIWTASKLQIIYPEPVWGLHILLLRFRHGLIISPIAQCHIRKIGKMIPSVTQFDTHIQVVNWVYPPWVIFKQIIKFLTKLLILKIHDYLLLDKSMDC